MYLIKFRYVDKYSKGRWCYQECHLSSVEECIRVYGLDVDCYKYEILDVIPL